MHQRGERAAADDELEGEKARQAEIALERPLLTHMHQPGLHPAFVYLFAGNRRWSRACILCC
jgi:hypothetical protein